jgi:uncharacterized DUF497 family protein
VDFDGDLTFGFDPGKDVINRRKHVGLSLSLAEQFDWRSGFIAPAKTVEGEARWKFVTAYDGIVYAVIFTLRDAEVIWVISLRRASRTERRTYAKATTP